MKDGSDRRPESDPAIVISRRTLSRVLIVTVAVVVLAGIGIGAFLVGRSTAPDRGASATSSVHKVVSSTTLPTTTTSSVPTTSSAPASTTTAPPSTTVTTAPPIPQVTDCGRAPASEPTALYWCISECSSYMTNIVWSTRGPDSATGTGTFVTKTTTPRTGQTFVPCATAIPVHHPGTPALLSDPQYVTVCSTGALEKVLVFTRASWWTKSTYALRPRIQTCG